MRLSNLQRWQISEILISLFVFFVLAFYNHAILFLVPYSGFAFNISNGRIVELYTQPKQGLPTLQTGDILKKVGHVLWETYEADSQVQFFDGVQTGEIVNITIDRNGEEVFVPWEYMGFDTRVFLTRLINVQLLSFVFFFIGAPALALIRPRDTVRNLFVAINYLTALWLMFGSLSSFHIWSSSILLRAITWLLLPIYLHFHWIFPQLIKPLSKTFVVLFYFICSCFAIAEVFQILHKSLYVLAFAIALVGSFILMVIQYRKNPRRRIRLIALAIVIAFLPSIVLGILVSLHSVPDIAPLGLFSLPFMSVVYFYAIYRRKMGGAEIRLNLIISSYLFLILFAIALFITVVPLVNLNLQVENVLIISIIVILALVYFAIRTFPNFQKFVEKRFLGITIDYEKLQESFSNLIVNNTTMNSLLQTLEEKIFPSLLIRQYSVVQVENHHLHLLLTKNVTQAQLPEKEAISNLHQIAGQFIPNLSPNDDWLRLVLPLKVGDSTLGFFLLGSRDPDDIYHQQEISSMQSIANQTGVALSNILRAETLREMHERGIHRYEQERLRLSHELHDSVLHELSELRKHLEQVSPKVDETYEIIKDRLREVINDLRPPALDNGLTYALKTLAENLMQKSNDTLKVQVNLHASEERLSEDIELHLFRIVEESCNNTVRHAQAKLIKIEGSISPQHVDLSITDDGVGFEINEKWNLRTLLASRHFGLVGMFERTHLIGATLNLQSQPKQGTRVQVLWSVKH